MVPNQEKNQERNPEWITLRISSSSEILYLEDGTILVKPRRDRPRVISSLADARRALQKALPTVSMFDAFVLDCFPAIKRMFVSGMDRIERTNLLLESVEAEELLQRLHDYTSEEAGVVAAELS